MSELTLLGQSGVTGGHLEWFPNPAPEVIRLITFTTHEFTSRCPVTGQPDFATIIIRYVPDERCVESKSLKLYLQTFRERGAFAEALAAEIRSAVVSTLETQRVQVTVQQAVRGGLALEVVAGEC